MDYGCVCVRGGVSCLDHCTTWTGDPSGIDRGVGREWEGGLAVGKRNGHESISSLYYRMKEPLTHLQHSTYVVHLYMLGCLTL